MASKRTAEKEKNDSKSARPTKDRFPNLQSTLCHLDQPGNKYQFEALVAVRKKFTKDQKSVAVFRQHGGMQKLLDILSHHKTSNKMKDVCLSILGNCCMDTKCRKEVLWKDGVSVICEVIMSVKEDSIQNRAGRTLGNLALDTECCSTIHQQEDILTTIVNLFNNATNNDSKMTFARTIRLLGDSAAHQRAVIAADGLKPLGELLKADHEPLVTAGLKGITELTKVITAHSSRQLIAAEVPSSLLQLTSHSSSTLATASESLILNYVKSEELRPAIGAAGGLKFFIDRVKDPDLSTSKRLSMVNALCLCCHDSVNRFRLRNNEGLELLLGVLKQNNFNLIHNRVISALVCFLYDDASLEILLENGLIEQLVHHLRRIAKLGPELKEKEDFQAKLSQSWDLDEQELVQQTDEGKCIEDPHTDTEADSSTYENQDDLDCTINSSDLPTDSAKQNTDEVTEMFVQESSENVTEDVAQMLDEQLTVSDDTISNTCTSGHSVKTVAKLLDEQLIVSANVSSTSNLEPSLSMKADNMAKSSEASTSERKPTLKESQSEPILSTTNEVKYSIDSPTYQVSEWNYEEYFTGPKNIHESANYAWASSPEMIMPAQSPPRSSPYSPLSTGSADWSPEHSPVRSLSPSTSSPTAKIYSPLSSPGQSPYHVQMSPEASGNFSPLLEPHSPDWSPTSLHNCSPQGSPAGSSTNWDSPWWYMPTVNDPSLKYSSDEETESASKNNTQPVQKNTESSVNDKSQQTSDISTVDSSYKLQPQIINTSSLDSESVSKNTDNLVLPGYEEITNIESKTTEAKSKMVSRADLKGKGKPKEKPDAKKVLVVKRGSRSSDSNVDLNKLLAEMPKTPEPTSEVTGAHHAKDSVKVTEHNLLVILSKLSYLNDPSKHLMTLSVWCCLLDYIGKASKPLPRAERILIRLVRNPLCFEAIVQNMIPFYIAYHFQAFLAHRKSIATNCSGDSTSSNLSVNNSKSKAKANTGSVASTSVNDSKSKTRPDSTPSSKRVNFMIGDEEVPHGSESEKSNKLDDCDDTVKDEYDLTGQTDSKTTDQTDNVGCHDNLQFLKPSSELAKHQDQLFSNLVNVAESRYGQGILSHNLLTKSSQVQQQSSISLAYLCRSRELRKKMYITMNGLASLQDALSGEDNTLQTKAMCSLLQLSKELKLKPCTKRDQSSLYFIDDLYCSSYVDDNDVTFLLNDGTRVEGNREILSAASQVFAAMLQGHYAERNQSEIILNDVSSQAFQILINHLHRIGRTELVSAEDVAPTSSASPACKVRKTGQGQTIKTSSERGKISDKHTESDVAAEASNALSTQPHTSIDVLLEVFSLSDRYMLDILKDLVVHYISVHYLCLDNVVEICEFALTHSCDTLAENCLAYLFSSAASVWARVSVLQKVFSLPEHSQLQLFIRDLIKKYINL